MRLVILYHSTDGQTLKIARRIQQFLQENNQRADIFDLLNDTISILDYDVIIIGARIRYGKHHKSVYKFVRKNRECLKHKTTAFFSVSLVARKSNKAIPKNNNYLKKFLSQVDWQPSHIAAFAGKLNYPKYGLIDKLMTRFIMKITDGPTNTGKSYEFTDWNAVDHFANNLLTHCQTVSGANSDNIFL